MTKLFTKSHDDITRFFVSDPDPETIEVPQELIALHDSGRLRIVDGAVVDIDELSGPFFVSPADLNLKHIVAGPGWVQVDCFPRDRLDLDDAGHVVVWNEQAAFRRSLPMPPTSVGRLRPAASS